MHPWRDAQQGLRRRDPRPRRRARRDGRARRRSRRRCDAPRPRSPAVALRRSCCCRVGRRRRRARRPTARCAARRRLRRRAACLPPTRGEPSPGRGTPWWRRPPADSRTRRRPHDTARAGAPRRTRTAVCRTPPRDLGPSSRRSRASRRRRVRPSRGAAVPGARSSHIASGAWMPSSPRPWASVRPVTSHSASRLVRTGSSARITGQCS